MSENGVKKSIVYMFQGNDHCFDVIILMWIFIFQEDVLLVVGPKKYCLHVQLPQKVDEDKSAASFNTLTQEMLIKLPTKQL